MKKFLLGCIVGGFVVSKAYDWALKYYDYTVKPEKHFSDIFNDLKWDREDHIKNAIERLKEESKTRGYLTIDEMFKIFDLPKTPGESFKIYKYAVFHGLTYDDICKITPLKNIRDGNWRLDFHDGMSHYFNHFTKVKWEEDENNEKEESR